MKDVEPSKVDRRQFIRLATVLGGGLFLTACGPQAAAPTPTAAPKSSSSGPTPAAKPKLSADIQFASTAGGIGPPMLPLLVAQELFLKDEGITEKITAFQGGGDTVRALVTGGHVIGHPAPSAVALAVDAGEPAIIIAENQPFSSLFWVVRSDSAVKSMKDLKGKKLGYSRPGSVSQTVAFTAFRAVGLNPDNDVTMVAAGGGPDQLAAVLGGVIDAGWLTDPILTQSLLKKEVRVIGTSNDFLPMWSDSMLASTREYAKTNGDVLAAYLRAHQKALDFIKSSPDKAAEIWGKGQNMDPDVAKASIKNYPIERYTSRVSPDVLKVIGNDMVTNNQLKVAPDWKKIVDQSFLAPELRSTI